MTKLYAVLLAVLLLPTWGRAQNVLKGRVSGSDEPNGLPGAAIQVANTTRGTNSQIDGTFSINLEPEDSVLIVSYVGYVTQRVNIVGKASVEVVLALDVKTSDEVVVVGYGTQRKSDVTGSVGSLKGADITKVPNSNPMQALQGKVAGIQVTSTSGQPGEGVSVRIRGIGTLTDAASGPLYVVDGVFMDNINNINSQDIESIEVLKDASAAAIFGIRGANGVVLVTTKRGKSGKTRFNFTAEYSQQSLTKHINMLDGHEYARTYVALGLRDPINNINLIPRTDWQAAIFQEAKVTPYKPWEFFTQNNTPIQNYQFSASGGGEKGTYYFGVGYFNQAGILPNSNYERITLRLNNEYKLNDWWKIGQNLTIAPSRQRLVNGSTVQRAYWADPSVAPYLSQARGDTVFSPVNTGNPLAELQYGSNTYNKRLAATGNVYSEISLPYGFRYRWNFGIDINSNRSVGFVPQYYVGPTQNSPYASLNTGREWTNNLLMDNILYWNKDFGKHSFDAFVATSVYDYYFEELRGAAINLISSDPNDWYLNTGDRLANSSTEKAVSRRQLSYFGRANYTYDGKYLVTVTSRTDGSSLFAPGKQYATFPSAALGWVASREDFLKDVREISNLKLRASIGRLGNQAVDVAQQNARFYLTDPSTPAVFGSGNALTQGVSVGVTPNPNIKWETTTQINAGFELGMLNNRLTIEADYYNRRSDNILVPLSTPLYYGNGPNVKVLFNAASVENKGFEFTLNWRDQIGSVGYRLGALGTTVNNKVLSIGESVPADKNIYDGSGAQGRITRTTAGEPIGSFYGYKVIGLYQNDQEALTLPSTGAVAAGDLRYADLNGDGKINGDDRTFIGSPIPKFIFGFNAGASYKNFDLSLEFQGQTGNYIYNDKATQRFGSANFEAYVRDAWTPTNTNTNVPRVTAGGNNYYISDFWVQKGDFLRLRTATLSYTLPKSVAERVKAEQVSIYLRATNLLTWTAYTGYTPEVSGTVTPPNNNAGILSSGIDGGAYPVSRVVTLGANVTF